MCNFLLQSCIGLRELRVEDAHLLSGSWASLFESLRQLSSLQVCEFRDLLYEYNASYGSQGWTTLLRDLESMDLLSDYLCGRTHTDPWPGTIAEEYRQIAEEDSEEDEDEDDKDEEQDEDDDVDDDEDLDEDVDEDEDESSEQEQEEDEDISGEA